MSGVGGSETRGGYLPGLDGLRALAVLAVIAYHGSASWLPGGYLGVEVFFVVSGFIITRGLLAEGRERRINLGEFWRRRALRLLPAVLLLLLAILSYALVFEPDIVTRLRSDVLAALGYVTNWHLVLSDQSYFQSWERPSLVRHLWSLAIEEQFYLVWGLFAWLVIGRGLRAGFLAALVLLLALAAYGNMAWQYQGLDGADASRLYYGTDTRFGALLIGAALAFVMPAWGSRRRAGSAPLLSIAGLMALGLLAFYAAVLDQEHPALYQGGFLLTSLATAILIVAAATPGLWLTRLLGAAPLRWMGQRSYGIYLWHWPILLLTWPSEPDLPWLFGAQVIASIGIAGLSYRFLEQPIRNGGIDQLWRWTQERRRALRVRLTWAGLYTASAALGLFAAVVATAQAPEMPAALAQDSIRISSTAEPVLSEQVSSLQELQPSGQSRPDDFRPSLESWPHPCEESLGGAQGYGDTRDWPFSRCPEAPSQAEATPTPAEATPVPADEDPSEEPAKNEPETVSTTVVQTVATQAPPANVAPPAPLDPATAAGRITAVGDSVMLGAAHDLAANIPGIDVDASVGRQLNDALWLLYERYQTGQLGDTLLLHLGNNGTFTAAQFDKIMEIAGPNRKVIFLNVRVPRSWQDGNNAVISAGVARYPNAVLIDWYSATANVSGIFIDDGVHLRREGSWLYTQLVQQALQ